ncbi:MAG TPA: serpin family protein, partial [Polyangiaceae bacterium]|nr:serpin family protein [Polyangiaceae bacterium]
MRNTYFFIPALFAALAACGGESDSPQDTDNPNNNTDKPQVARSELERAPASSVSSDTVDAIVQADNAFAFDLFAKARASAKSSNTVMSPLSVSIALGMTWAGARNQTAEEMAKTLHFDKPGLDVHAGHNALTQTLESRAADALANAKEKAKLMGSSAPSEDNFRLHIVNSVWADGSYTWERPFLDTLAVNYGAGVFLADFIHEYDAERERINTWVSNETQNKINNLLPDGSLDENTRMVLVNAIHLRMPWELPFEKDFTKPGDFTTADGSMVTAEFMSQDAPFGYYEDAAAQVVSLPLVGRQLSLVVALPKDSLESYEAGLTAASWKAVWEARETKPVDLALPKFSFTTDAIKLKEVFQQLGMVQAFEAPMADFYG